MNKTRAQCHVVCCKCVICSSDARYWKWRTKVRLAYQYFFYNHFRCRNDSKFDYNFSCQRHIQLQLLKYHWWMQNRNRNKREQILVQWTVKKLLIRDETTQNWPVNADGRPTPLVFLARRHFYRRPVEHLTSSLAAQRICCLSAAHEYRLVVQSDEHQLLNCLLLPRTHNNTRNCRQS